MLGISDVQMNRFMTEAVFFNEMLSVKFDEASDAALLTGPTQIQIKKTYFTSIQIQIDIQTQI